MNWTWQKLKTVSRQDFLWLNIRRLFVAKSANNDSDPTHNSAQIERKLHVKSIGYFFPLRIILLFFCTISRQIGNVVP